MSQQTPQHIVLDSLDRPVRVLLIFTTGECLLLVLPLLLGFCLNSAILGSLMSAACYTLMKKLNKSSSQRRLSAYYYRYFPSAAAFKPYPPSHIQQFNS